MTQVEVVRRKVADAPAAEAAVRDALQSQHGDSLRRVSFRKCWFSVAGKQEFWDVEGAYVRSKRFVGREIKSFRYQVDAENGRIIGYELIVPPRARR